MLVNILRVIKSRNLHISFLCLSMLIYDGPSVKEKIFFSPPYFFFWGGGRKYIWIYFHHRIFGGENIFKCIFTTVFFSPKNTVVKINLNIFSPPKHDVKNIFEYIFSSPPPKKKNTVVKINLNIFSPQKIRCWKYIYIYFLPPKYGGVTVDEKNI